MFISNFADNLVKVYVCVRKLLTFTEVCILMTAICFTYFRMEAKAVLKYEEIKKIKGAIKDHEDFLKVLELVNKTKFVSNVQQSKCH